MTIQTATPTAASQMSEEAARFLNRPHRAFIKGAFTDEGAGEAIAVHDPATGRVIAEVPEYGAAGVEAAVVAARAALEGPWSRMRPADREKLILDLANAIEADGALLAELETLENGKSIGIARGLSVGGSVEWLRYFAGWATKIEGSSYDTSIAVPPGSHHFSATIKEPVGVVAAIVPWNFPLLMGIWKIAPALACGCTVILKPAEETPLTALRLAEIAARVGLPEGVLNIVTGRGSVTGAALTAHPGVDKITFTGSTEVGQMIGRKALDTMTRFTLELGGKSPMIICADADQGQEPLMAGLGMFFNQGQVCTSASRLLIEKSVYDRTLEALAGVADSMTLGSGLDPNAQINPLVSARHRNRVNGFIERAEAAGARRICGARTLPEGGYFVAPTIFDGVSSEMEIVQEEVFGPVVAAMTFTDLDEAIRLANDSRYGLAASIWTRDLNKAFHASRALKAGTVWVNSHNTVDANAPFGGYKQSGIGREHGRAALDAYLESKTVIIRYS
ncbi:MAG: aldehyde dehydrogenase family protein [Pannonibacter sp.]